MGHQLYC